MHFRDSSHTVSCNRRPYLVPACLHHPRGKHVALGAHSPFSPFLGLWHSVACFLLLGTLLLQTFPTIRFIRRGTSGCLASVTQHSLSQVREAVLPHRADRTRVYPFLSSRTPPALEQLKQEVGGTWFPQC